MSMGKCKLAPDPARESRGLWRPRRTAELAQAAGRWACRARTCWATCFTLGTPRRATLIWETELFVRVAPVVRIAMSPEPSGRSRWSTLTLAAGGEDFTERVPRPGMIMTRWLVTA